VVIKLRIDFNSIKPIYLQIAEAVEDDILSGKLSEGGPAYSQLVLSRELGVNPATAAKGLLVLVQKGVLEKVRGQSMAVTEGAKARLRAEKRNSGFETLVQNLAAEAARCGVSEKELTSIIHGYYLKEGGKDHE